jgi:hypothetical protein
MEMGSLVLLATPAQAHLESRPAVIPQMAVHSIAALVVATVPGPVDVTSRPLALAARR